jgi:hypothetical protein
MTDSSLVGMSWTRSGLQVQVIEECDNCFSRNVSTESVVFQGISCLNCGNALCNACFAGSKLLGGTVGDHNNDLPETNEPKCPNFPFEGYYPPSYGGVGTLRACIMCFSQLSKDQQSQIKLHIEK